MHGRSKIVVAMNLEYNLTPGYIAKVGKKSFKYNLSNLSSNSERLRNVPLDIDFNVTHDCKTSSEDNLDMCISKTSENTLPKQCYLPDCQVVLDDIFSSDQTEKLKTLKICQDKTQCNFSSIF